MRRKVGLAAFMASLCAGLLGFAHAEIHFNPPDNPDGLNCVFYPMVSTPGDGNELALKPSLMGPAKIAKARKVFHYYEAEYRVEYNGIYIPCKYYSDPSFLLTITKNLLAPGDDYPEITREEKK